jgi:D-3-phosphoglycerate dehydrogenase / 2-oxoglutarate reductase
MAKKKILLPSSMSQAGWQVVRARSDIQAVSFDMSIPTTEFHAILASADGVGLSLTRFGEAELKAAGNIKVVARHGVGYDMIDLPSLTRSRVPLMITGIANSPSVAEHALYLMLELAKRGTAFHSMVAENRWDQRMAQGLPMDLFEKTVLIVGFGRIGTRLAKMCIALDMQVCVFDPYVDAAKISAAGCNPEQNLHDALAKADFVSINCPKTKETNGLVADAQFARMKPTAFIVNTARGGIVEETALHTALTTGRIAGAGLDVLELEPPDPQNPLLKLPNIVLAPHMAGVTREALDRMAVSLVNNILSVLDGRPDMDNVVNKEIYGHH